MKFKKSISACLLVLSLFGTFVPAMAIGANVVYANSEVGAELQSITFTSDDFLEAARKVYREGKITKEQYMRVESIAFERLGRKGQNKTVQVGHLLYDYYIDNVTWTMMVSLGGGEVGLVIGAIPGINASVAGLISSVVGAGFSTYYGADKGVIIRIQYIRGPLKTS
ncbi:hypothetical protein [Streptococcus acidominimus]|nr:hypothetical protein [Streptococcus acidominimus]OLF48676.1 hypothetical protein BU200_09675 [Streptococcus acidominimus]